MGTSHIPEKYRHVCDWCGADVEKTSKSRPSGWAAFLLERGAADHTGAEVADASERRLFCGLCADAVVKALNHLLKGKRP